MQVVGDTISIGDTVVLKSQRTSEIQVWMTVNGIRKDPTHRTGVDSNYLECVWYDTYNRLCVGEFHFNSLAKVI